jgi:hypothetical protein
MRNTAALAHHFGRALGAVIPLLLPVLPAAAQSPGAPRPWSDQPVAGLDAPVPWPLIGLLLAIALLTLAGSLAVWRARRREARPEVELPLMFISRPVPPPPPLPAPTPAPAPARVSAAAAPSPAVLVPAPPGIFSAPEPEVVEGATVRFYRPDASVLQLLPGSLEVLEGADRGQELRFVRTQAGAVEVTFGRSEGPAFRHVQLHAATVSRTHAALRFESGVWQIRNLSQTNPVVINGQELESADAARTLRDGDRIEMGEVVFRFHASAA